MHLKTSLLKKNSFEYRNIFFLRKTESFHTIRVAIFYTVQVALLYKIKTGFFFFLHCYNVDL